MNLSEEIKPSLTSFREFCNQYKTNACLSSLKEKALLESKQKNKNCCRSVCDIIITNLTRICYCCEINFFINFLYQCRAIACVLN